MPLYSLKQKSKFFNHMTKKIMSQKW